MEAREPPMANKRDSASTILATVPAIAAVAAGIGSALLPENVEKIRAFFSNPLNAGAIAVYATAVLVTAILFQLVLSARFNDRRGQRSEPSPEAVTTEPPEPSSLTAEERALR